MQKVPSSILIKNCRLYNQLQSSEVFNIETAGGKIKKISKHKILPNKNSIVLDARGKILCPGFIDVHIQGAGGSDVLDATYDALNQISKTCASFGVTGFLATTVYKINRSNKHLDIAAQNTNQTLEGANLLGIHLEGPFISLKKKGMISPLCICEVSGKVCKDIKLKTKNTLKIMTIAPELAGAIPIIKKLSRDKTVVSFGHSSASYEETILGIRGGITHATHFFNAMPSLHHREPGPVLAILRDKKITVQVIPDGVHLHKDILKFVFDIIGPQRWVSITDGMQAMGLPEGKYVYNGIEYTSKNGTARYKDGTLIGTSLGLNVLLKKMIEFTGCSFLEAIKTATENPARVLGIGNRKGTIAAGMDADLAIIDKNFSVFYTIVNGKVVFKS